MKSLLTPRSFAAWMLFFCWLELFPFRGALAWMDGVRFPLAFLLVACFYIPEFWLGPAALAAGVILDSMSAPPVNTPLLVGAFYAAGLSRRAFYYQGSPFHISFFLAIFLAAFTVEFFAVSGWYAGFPARAVLGLSLLNFAWFLLLLFLFQKKDQAVTYKMMR